MDKKLNFADLKLSQAAFEVRYDKNYKLWDHAGSLWTGINSLWPGLKLDKIDPNAGHFLLENQYDLSVTLENAHIIDLKPSSNLNTFMERADIFIGTIIPILEMAYFTRIGFRLIFTKDFPDRVTAANYLLSAQMLLVPEGRKFSIEGKILLPRFAFLWEGEATASRIALEVRDKKVDFDAHPSVEELSSIHLEKHEFVYDIDYYTLGKLTIGQLNTKEWLNQTYHLIKRDSNFFLGGR